MARYQDTLWCDGCGVEVTWGALVQGKRIYCCQDCLEGLGCDCANRIEFDEERRPREHSQAAEAVQPC